MEEDRVPEDVEYVMTIISEREGVDEGVEVNHRQHHDKGADAEQACQDELPCRCGSNRKGRSEAEGRDED